MLKAQKRYAEAEPIYAEVYERAARSQLAPPVAAPLMSGYGPCLVKLAKYADADQPLREAHRRWNELNQPTNPRMRDIVSGLVEVCERTNRPQEAAQWRAELENLAATKPKTP
jgi:eukaryotic-like serine/threonine-protein kinase